MKNDSLTAYDRFIINKKGGVNEKEPEVFSDSEKASDSDTFFSKGYASYIENELRRTGPSATKVMTMDEYESMERSNGDKDRLFRALSGEKRTEKERGIRFTKFGKILLIAYIIIMLALALIVIVKTTVGDNVISADAAGKTVEEESSGVQAMELSEEEEESDDWFDHLCDSLK